MQKETPYIRAIMTLHAEASELLRRPRPREEEGGKAEEGGHDWAGMESKKMKEILPKKPLANHIIRVKGVWGSFPSTQYNCSPI